MNTNDYLTGRKPVPTGDGVELLAQRFELDLVVADLALNQIGAIGILPAGHIPVGVIPDADDLDSNGTPTLTFTIGILNAAGTDLSTTTADGGAVWGTTNIGRTGGQEQIYSKALSRVQSDSGADRKIGIKVTAAAATAVAGKFGLTLLYRPN